MMTKHELVKRLELGELYVKGKPAWKCTKCGRRYRKKSIGLAQDNCPK